MCASPTSFSSPQAARAAWRAALEWQLEAGVDETIGDAPVDRLRAEPAPPAAAQAPQAAPAKRPKAAAKPAQRDPVETAREAAQAAGDIAALRAALERFEGSALKAGASRTVFADGDPQARLMVVGEAPGREEDKAGLPFVGRSGQLLDRMLGAIGLSRGAEDPAKAAYISNVIPWRPLQNRTPDDREVTMLLPFIERHIELARPEIVLCVGNIPSKTLMGASAGITRFRGTWKELEFGGARFPALASFHPAYLLRSPEQKRLAWRDLLSLAERLESRP